MVRRGHGLAGVAEAATTPVLGAMLAIVAGYVVATGAAKRWFYRDEPMNRRGAGA